MRYSRPCMVRCRGPFFAYFEPGSTDRYNIVCGGYNHRRRVSVWHLHRQVFLRGGGISALLLLSVRFGLPDTRWKDILTWPIIRPRTSTNLPRYSLCLAGSTPVKCEWMVSAPWQTLMSAISCFGRRRPQNTISKISGMARS